MRNYKKTMTGLIVSGMVLMSVGLFGCGSKTESSASAAQGMMAHGGGVPPPGAGTPRNGQRPGPQGAPGAQGAAGAQR